MSSGFIIFRSVSSTCWCSSRRSVPRSGVTGLDRVPGRCRARGGYQGRAPSPEEAPVVTRLGWEAGGLQAERESKRRGSSPATRGGTAPHPGLGRGLRGGAAGGPGRPAGGEGRPGIPGRRAVAGCPLAVLVRWRGDALRPDTLPHGHPPPPHSSSGGEGRHCLV